MTKEEETVALILFFVALFVVGSAWEILTNGGFADMRWW